MTFYTFVYSQVLFGLPLQTTTLFGTEAGALLYGKSNALNTVVIGNPIIVSLTRKWLSLSNVALGGVFFAVEFAMISIAKSSMALFLCCAFFTIGEVFWTTNERYFVANNTSMSHRARFNDIIPIIKGTGYCFAPMVGGMVIDSFSMTWLGSSLSVLVGVIIVLALKKKERKMKTA